MNRRADRRLTHVRAIGKPNRLAGQFTHALFEVGGQYLGSMWGRPAAHGKTTRRRAPAAEILGCYLVLLWLKQGRSAWLLALAGMAVIVLQPQP